MSVLNLEVFEEGTHQFEVKGKSYTIDKQPPIGLMLALQSLPEGLEGMKKGLELLHKVFTVYNDIEYEDFSMLFTMQSYVAVLNFVLAGISAEETKAMLEDSAKQAEELDGKKKPGPAEKQK